MSRLILCVGQFQLDYEGDDIPPLNEVVETFNKLGTSFGALVEAHCATIPKSAERDMSAGKATPSLVRLSEDESVTSVTTRLGVKTAPDLVLAACAYLKLSQQQSDYTRRDILATMPYAES